MKLLAQLKMEYPGADITAESVPDHDGPYLMTRVVIKRVMHEYNPAYNAVYACECEHSYDRHFDPYEGMAPVGCKYCGCGCYVPAPIPMPVADRLAKYENWKDWDLTPYILQWEMFGDIHGRSLTEYIGGTPSTWLLTEKKSALNECNARMCTDEDEFVEVE